MIIAIDTETEGLDCTKYIVGCIIKETQPNKPEIYWNKKELWGRILELGNKLAKHNKVLKVYAHNHIYDFYAYADILDKNIVYHCTRPFITSYLIDGKQKIKFLDTMAIYRMSLKKAGELIGLKKKETPKELLTGGKINKEETLKYLIRDTKIVLESVLRLKKQLKESGVNVKRLYTINQIGVNYLIDKIRKKNPKGFFYKDKMRNVQWTRYPEMIHKAYRGGRVQAFNTGKFNDATYIDVNSLYPYTASKMRFPDLQSEYRAKNPLKHISQKELLDKIGISMVCIKNQNNDLGLIPIRTKWGNYFPKKDKIIIGTYTNQEIKNAIENGYKLLEIKESVLYDETENPLNEIMTNLYKIRKQSKDKYFNFFYKMMMNASIGKLAQKKNTKDIIIRSVEEYYKLIKEGYTPVKGIDYNYIYEKDTTGDLPKNYYCPIIPTIINADARIFMNNNYSKINKEDILYTDTDSIVFKGNHINKFKISDKMGDFKIEYEKADCDIIGRKDYMIQERIVLSGVPKNQITIKDFKKRKVVQKKMITLRTAKEIKEVGKFKETDKDLSKHQQEYKLWVEENEEKGLFIDSDIKDISYFLDKIENFI